MSRQTFLRLWIHVNVCARTLPKQQVDPQSLNGPLQLHWDIHLLLPCSVIARRRLPSDDPFGQPRLPTARTWQPGSGAVPSLGMLGLSTTPFGHLGPTVAVVHSRKAPGHDEISHDHLKLAVPEFAQASFSLALKCAATLREPLRWKGGCVSPFYKLKGPTDDPNSFRSILVSETLGKRFHSWVRRTLLPRLDVDRLPTHAEVTGGMTTAFMTVALRAFQDQMRMRRKPHAILFVDLRAAFTQFFVSSFITRQPPRIVYAHSCRAWVWTPSLQRLWRIMWPTRNAKANGWKRRSPTV